ncbi:MAG: nucleoside triphosphate pyrophosphohydrolase family protein [Humibacillus sp.]|nr:nucleoside triphosphate pyrophosphohydrolase family protein [Humibacillus sp.]MDN5780081.1 nucleoside triphosphate pyrophosphohydrolase family protein [Humibacillus sp.]
MTIKRDRSKQPDPESNQLDQVTAPTTCAWWKTRTVNAETREKKARTELAEARHQLARTDVTTMTAQMHRHLGAHINDGPPSAEIPEQLVEVRIALAEEELVEYRDAPREGDIVEIADGLADLIYVLYGHRPHLRHPHRRPRRGAPLEHDEEQQPRRWEVPQGPRVLASRRHSRARSTQTKPRSE